MFLKGLLFTLLTFSLLLLLRYLRLAFFPRNTTLLHCTLLSRYGSTAWRYAAGFQGSTWPMHASTRSDAGE